MIATAAGCAPFYIATGSALMTAVFAAAGILIDLDHLIDFALWDERPLDPKRFLKDGVPRTWPRLVYLLHGYEWIALMAFICFKTHNPYILSFTLGWALHLAIDEFGNRLPSKRTRIFPLFYFFTYRLFFGFRRDRIAWIKEC